MINCPGNFSRALLLVKRSAMLKSEIYWIYLQQLGVTLYICISAEYISVVSRHIARISIQRGPMIRNNRDSCNCRWLSQHILRLGRCVFFFFIFLSYFLMVAFFFFFHRSRGATTRYVDRSRSLTIEGLHWSRQSRSWESIHSLN